MDIIMVLYYWGSYVSVLDIFPCVLQRTEKESSVVDPVFVISSRGIYFFCIFISKLFHKSLDFCCYWYIFKQLIESRHYWNICIAKNHVRLSSPSQSDFDLQSVYFWKPFLKILPQRYILLIFRKRGRGKEEREDAGTVRERALRETSIGCPLYLSGPGIESEIYVCALIGSWTCSFLVCGLMLQSTQPGLGNLFKKIPEFNLLENWVKHLELGVYWWVEFEDFYYLLYS